MNGKQKSKFPRTRKRHEERKERSRGTEREQEERKKERDREQNGKKEERESKGKRNSRRLPLMSADHFSTPCFVLGSQPHSFLEAPPALGERERERERE